MTKPIKIEREAIYEDPAARLSLDVTGALLAKARREGTLKYTRRGRRIYYKGEWLMAWLTGEPAAREPAMAQ